MEATLKSFEKVMKTYGEGIAKTLSAKYGFDLTEALEFIQTDIQKPKKEKKQPTAKTTDGEPKKRGRKPKEPSSPSTSGDESTEKLKKKVGRPKKDNTGEVNANAGDDLIARLVAEAKAESINSAEIDKIQVAQSCEPSAPKITTEEEAQISEDVVIEADTESEAEAPTADKTKPTKAAKSTKAAKPTKAAKAAKAAEVEKANIQAATMYTESLSEEARLARDAVFAASNTENASVKPKKKTKKDIAVEANSDVEETANKIIDGNAPRKSKSKNATCVDDKEEPKTKPAKADKPKKKTKKEITDEAKAAAELEAKSKAEAELEEKEEQNEASVKSSLEEEFEKARINAEAEAKANAEAEAKANAEAEAKANTEANADSELEEEADDESEQSEQDDDIAVKEFIHDGEKYLITDDGVIYDIIEQTPIGTWNEEKQTIDFMEIDD